MTPFLKMLSRVVAVQRKRNAPSCVTPALYNSHLCASTPIHLHVSDRQLPVEVSVEHVVETKEGHDGEPETAPEEIPVVVVEISPEFISSAVMIQAAWRGFFAKKAYEEIRVTRQWAAVKVQSAFRGRKAARAFSKHMRCVMLLLHLGSLPRFAHTSTVEEKQTRLPENCTC